MRIESAGTKFKSREVTVTFRESSSASTSCGINRNVVSVSSSVSPGYKPSGTVIAGASFTFSTVNTKLTVSDADESDTTAVIVCSPTSSFSGVQVISPVS